MFKPLSGLTGFSDSSGSNPNTSKHQEKHLSPLHSLTQERQVI